MHLCKIFQLANADNSIKKIGCQMKSFCWRVIPPMKYTVYKTLCSSHLKHRNCFYYFAACLTVCHGNLLCYYDYQIYFIHMEACHKIKILVF